MEAKRETLLVCKAQHVCKIKGTLWLMYPKTLESIECLEKALEVQLKELGEEHATRHVADTYAKLGWTCSRDGKYDKAMEYQQKGLSIRLKVHGGEDHVDVGHSHHALGNVYDEKGKYEEALKHYEISLRIQGCLDIEALVPSR